MARERENCTHSTEEESQKHSSSPKPPLTRIRSLLGLSSPSTERRGYVKEPASERRPVKLDARMPVHLASQALSQEVASLSRQPTLELRDMGDSVRPGMERRKSSRLNKVPSGSLTVDEICRAPSRSSSSARSLTRSSSKTASIRASKVNSDVSDLAPRCEDEKLSADNDEHEDAMDVDDRAEDAAVSAPEAPAAADAGPSDPHAPSAIELVISFDTTGSMSSCIAEVRKCVQELVQRLFMDIPHLRISIIAHGDYCDETTSYLLKQVDFTNDVSSLCEFVREVGSTSGGDFDECYEYVLHHVRNMTWSPGTQRALVMIGDATPHEPSYRLNKLKLDWKHEADQLRDELGVRIYGVQCKTHQGQKVTQFYQSLAKRTGGHYLKLEKFSSIVDILMAICYREKGAEFFDVFESEIRNRDGRHFAPEISNVFDTLRAPGTSRPLALVAPKSKKTYDLSKGAAKANKPRSPKGSTVKKSPKQLALKDKKVTKEAKEARKTEKKSCPKAAKVQREKLPPSKFILNKLAWSPWKAVMCQVRPNASPLWIRNSCGLPGERFRKPFTGMGDSALYEFAVQKGKGGRRYVMNVAATLGFYGPQWFSKLIAKRRNILDEVVHCINAGGTLCMRQAILPKTCTVRLPGKTSKPKVVLTRPSQYRGLLTRLYDYGWERGAKKPMRTKRFTAAS